MWPDADKENLLHVLQTTEIYLKKVDDEKK